MTDGLHRNNLPSSWHLRDTKTFSHCSGKQKASFQTPAMHPAENTAWRRKEHFAAHSPTKARRARMRHGRASQKNQRLSGQEFSFDFSYMGLVVVFVFWVLTPTPGPLRGLLPHLPCFFSWRADSLSLTPLLKHGLLEDAFPIKNDSHT